MRLNPLAGWLPLLLLVGASLGAEEIAPADGTRVPRVPRVPRKLPATAPPSLRDAGVDELMTWMGRPMGEWAPLDLMPNWRRLPAALRELPPREAALALAQANLDPAERREYETVFSAPAGASPPEGGWVIFEEFRRNYLDYEVVTWVRFAEGRAEIQRLAEVEEQLQWQSCTLEPSLARWLSDTLWWLSQLQLRERRDPGDAAMGFLARTYRSAISNHGATLRLSLIGRNGDTGHRLVSVEAYSGEETLHVPAPKSFLLTLASKLIDSVTGWPSVYEQTPAAAEDFRQRLTAASADRDPWPFEVLLLAAQGADAHQIAALQSKAAASDEWLPASVAARQRWNAVVAKQRRRGDAAALIRRLDSNDPAQRAEAIVLLGRLDATRAVGSIEQAMRRRHRPQWSDWRAITDLPESGRTVLLERLLSDRTLPGASRAEAESWLLNYTPDQKRDDARLAQFIANRDHAAKLRGDVCRKFLYRDQRAPSPALLDVMHRIANDPREPSDLRATAAMTLGAAGDQRGLTGLAKFFRGARQPSYPSESSQGVILAAVAETAPPDQRKIALAAFERRVGSRPSFRPEFAEAAWLGDLREAQDALQADAQRSGADTADAGEMTSSRWARATLLAWNEPDPFTRRKLVLIKCLASYPSYHVELAALRRRLDAQLEAASNADKERRREFAGEVVSRLRAANLSIGDEVLALLDARLGGHLLDPKGQPATPGK